MEDLTVGKFLGNRKSIQGWEMDQEDEGNWR